ncbi:hypothetical protein [Lutibacter sp.]|uniref:hypothetical protein n=1 Tax=Lutibacter sp. TaxID=1925666 RepID=UPI001A3192FC|nr:hypothetical protein [Lutibacter sp.]MBI9040737.1 hypothetical protein [Lutibacter sp.]
MKIKYLTIILLFSGTLFAQSFKYHPDDWKYTIDVENYDQLKSITTTNYTIKNGIETPVLETYMDWNYTQQLNSISFHDFTLSKVNYTVTINYMEPDSNLLNFIEVTNLENNTPIESYIYHYSPDGYTIENIKVERYSNNALISQFDIKYVYDDDWSRTTETIFTPTGTIEKQTKFSSINGNDENRSVKNIFLGANLAFDHSLEEIYDKEWITNFGNDYKNNETTKKTRFKYNEHNLLEAITENGVEVQRFEYTLDDNNNWIERKTLEKKNNSWNLVNITKRTITYRA